MENNITDILSAFDALNTISNEAEPQQNTCVNETATEVMAAYQNANKWLDSIKEAIYIHMNCPFFSSYVHELAHSMPVRFDAFGDILHTINMEIPYPATAEIASKPANLIDSFTMIFSCLDAIKVALNKFIECTDKEYHGMACAAEACLNDIESEYPMLYRLQAKAKECGEDTISFDKFVGQYNEHKGDLLESFTRNYSRQDIERCANNVADAKHMKLCNHDDIFEVVEFTKDGRVIVALCEPDAEDDYECTSAPEFETEADFWAYLD